MPNFSTDGERLAGRLLKQEKRLGVPHFVQGQMAAEAQVVVWVSYVNAMGHVVAIPFVKPDGEDWQHIGTALTAGQSTTNSKPLPEDFKPSKKMLAHLRRAERKLQRGDSD